MNNSFARFRQKNLAVLKKPQRKPKRPHKKQPKKQQQPKRSHKKISRRPLKKRPQQAKLRALIKRLEHLR